MGEIGKAISFKVTEYSGVWLPYEQDRLKFRKSVEGYLRETLSDPSGNLEVRDDGPHWINGKKITLSYAHTPRAAILVFSETHEIGVDVESSHRSLSTDVIRLARRFFHPSLLKQIEALPLESRVSRFLELWVRLEAYAKMTRKGLSRTIGESLPETSTIHCKNLAIIPKGYLGVVYLRSRENAN